MPEQRWSCVASSADGTKLIAVKVGDEMLAFISTNSGISWMSNSVGGMSGASVASSADGSNFFY
jgi:hypothetical protein